uniref:Leptin n=1 Tax=Salmo trutta TaxID=8032 RepID=A0A674B9I1_SALTR
MFFHFYITNSILCRLLTKKMTIKYILIPLCKTTKCEEIQWVGILLQGAVYSANFPSLRNSHLVALSSLSQLNDSLSQLYTDLFSFKLHVDWMIDARVNMSLPVSPKTLEVAKGLHNLSSFCSTALQQTACTLPQISIPSFPTQLKAWDVALLSYEIPERLRFYCQWSTRVLLLLRSKVQRL